MAAFVCVSCLCQRYHIDQSLQDVCPSASSNRCPQESGEELEVRDRFFFFFFFILAKINGTDYPLVNIPLMNSTKVFGECLKLSWLSFFIVFKTKRESA